MSGSLDGGICPRCRCVTLNIVSENRPFEYIDSYCDNCGFYSTTKTGIMPKDELADRRKEEEFKPQKFRAKPKEIKEFDKCYMWK